MIHVQYHWTCTYVKLCYASGKCIYEFHCQGIVCNNSFLNIVDHCYNELHKNILFQRWPFLQTRIEGKAKPRLMIPHPSFLCHQNNENSETNYVLPPKTFFFNEPQFSFCSAYLRGARNNIPLWKCRITKECSGISPHHPVCINLSINLQHDLGLRSLHHFRFCKEDSGQKTCGTTIQQTVPWDCGSSRSGLIFDRENVPKRMLTKFSRLVETLKSRIPAIDRGILFRDPTRLHIANQTISVLSIILITS